jgi:hypothetical protein
MGGDGELDAGSARFPARMEDAVPESPGHRATAGVTQPTRPWPGVVFSRCRRSTGHDTDGGGDRRIDAPGFTWRDGEIVAPVTLPAPGLYRRIRVTTGGNSPAVIRVLATGNA